MATAQRKAVDYYRSGMDTAAIEKAGLKPLAPVMQRIACRQNQNGQFAALFAPATQQRQPVLIGQTQIQNTDIKVRRQQGCVGQAGRAHVVHGEPMQSQARHNSAGDKRIIFNK